MSFVSDLEPRALWRHFDRLLEIPRPSKHEERARSYVRELAERHGLAHETDGTGNLLVRKPASRGRERAPVVVLQCHLDMVTEKNSDVTHDFARDPIRARLGPDGWMTATGTTLGADNGIGVAAMLAVLEDREIEHGPLELLFTVDEETGLTGAADLEPGWLAGRLLLNLDSEEEGLVTIGCAGGAESRVELPLLRGPVPAGWTGLELRLAGLRGGHSGLDINLGRGNATKLLARALWAAAPAGALRIADLQGGNKHNAIPREASATLAVEAAVADLVRGAIERELGAIAAEYRVTEPGLEHRVSGVPVPESAWDAGTTERALALLVALPHGVIAMSRDIPGLVETSVNLAAVAECGGALSILLSRRSSVATALEALGRRVRAVATLAGARPADRTGYPAWRPDPDSRLLTVLRRTHQDVFGREPEVGAVHAGLECGIIGEKHPGMEMVSFGPTIQFPHSPDERVQVETVPRFYELLTSTLAALAKA